MKSSIAYLVAPLVAWLAAQATKNLLGVRGRHGRVEKYLTSGGMPSAHTATVMALVTVIFAHEGFSDLLAVAICFTAITLYDALVARRSIGEQGIALTKLLKETDKTIPLPRVALGHRPSEVVVGACIGIVVGLVVVLFITN